MSVNEIFNGLSALNFNAFKIALRRPSELRSYLSHCMKKHDEVIGKGLRCRNPPAPADDQTITIPACEPDGGMNFEELVVLARTTKALAPKTIFEFGTYNGLTTAVFMLNAGPDARVFTLDLPDLRERSSAALEADQYLIDTRRLGAVPRSLGLPGYTQLLCDSLSFDTTPYLNTVDLGLIDAAHDLVHVRNDTIKMAQLMRQGGIVFWHDYGGRGLLGPLTTYLEDLGRRCPLYRVADTNFAWAPARELKQVLEEDRSRKSAEPLQ